MADITTIPSTQDVGDSLASINSNFANLNDAIAGVEGLKIAYGTATSAVDAVSVDISAKGFTAVPKILLTCELQTVSTVDHIYSAAVVSATVESFSFIAGCDNSKSSGVIVNWIAIGV